MSGGAKMLTAVQGYYNGEQIVLNENINLSYGQQVIVTILDKEPVRKKLDFAKYRMGAEHNIPVDAQEYVKELRDNDRF